MSKPIIAITMGDPASIGPEIAVKAFQEKSIHEICKPLLVGDAKVFEQIISKLNLSVKVNAVNKVVDAKFELGTIDVFDLNITDINKLQFGKMLGRPQFIQQYARHVKREMESQGIRNPIIQVDSWISLNGRPFQRAIDPQINLAEAPFSVFKSSPWILPLDPSARPGTLKPQTEEDKEKALPPPAEGPVE